MEEVQPSKSLLWVERANALLEDYARIHRGNIGLKTHETAFAYRFEVRFQSSCFSEAARALHLHRDPSFDRLKEMGWRDKLLKVRFPTTGWIAWLLSPAIGLFGAAKLVLQGAVVDRSLRRELAELKGKIVEHRDLIKALDEESDHFPPPEYGRKANYALKLSDLHLRWIDDKMGVLKGVECLDYSTALALTCWNLFGVLAFYSAFRPLPPGRWLYHSGLSAVAATIGALGCSFVVAMRDRCNGRKLDDADEKVDEFWSRVRLNPLEQKFLQSVDPQLDTEASYSSFARAMIYHRAACMKMVQEGETLTFGQPISFIWQDGQAHQKLAGESDLSLSEELYQEPLGT